jgi:hypothetical protein
MPRINIDDQFWIDMLSVVAKVNDEDRAIGNTLRWFRFAQEKHRDGVPIPYEDFQLHGFLDALIPMFAVRVGEFVVARGSEKYFGWLLKKSISGSVGGRISAQRERDDAGRLLPKDHAHPSTSKHAPSTSKHIQASSSLSKNNNTYTHLIQDALTHYPRRQGQLRKADALKRLEKQLKTESECAAFSAAVKAYHAECEAAGRVGTPYVMQLTTFANNWREVLERAADQPNLDDELRRGAF